LMSLAVENRALSGGVGFGLGALLTRFGMQVERPGGA
jgi:hypothetical protein